MPTTRAILAGIESSYGTDPTLDPSNNAIETTGLQITPLESDTIDRNLDTDQVGNTEAILTGKRVSCSFQVELTGGGTAGTEPPWGVLLRACGFAETVNAGTDVTYDMVDDLDTVESVYMYIYWVGKLHKLEGARGTVSISWPSRDVARFSFNFTGLFTAVSDQDIPSAADYSAFQDPTEVGNTETTFTLGGFSPEMESLELDLGYPVNFITRVGHESVELGNPEPSGQMTIKTPALTDYDYFANAGGSPVSATLTQGTTAGNIVETSIANVQTLAPTYTDLDDQGDGLQVPLRPIGSGVSVIVK